MRLHRTALLTVLTLAAGVSLGSAQSLADVARKEEARRQTIKEPSKTYTNKDLGGSGDIAVLPAPAPAPATPAGTSTEPETTAKPKEPARDQAYWSNRMKGLNGQLDRDQTLLAALETRVNSLNTDFVNRDDPAQRGVIEGNRKKTLAELTSLKQQVEADKKAIADLEEEGAPRQRAARLAALNALSCPAPLPIRRSSSSKTRTRCARCCATRSPVRATPSSKRGTRTKRRRRCARPGRASCCRICGCRRATASAS